MTYLMCIVLGMIVTQVELPVRFAEPDSDSNGDDRYPQVLIYNDRG